MKTRIRLLPVFFGILGTLCAAGSVTAVLRSIDKPPLLVEAPDSASDCAQHLMQSICQGNYVETSKLLLGQPDLELNLRKVIKPVAAVLARSLVAATKELPVKAIVFDTYTGRVGRYLSTFRPEGPMYALCYSAHTMRELALVRGVEPIMITRTATKEEFVQKAIETLQQRGYVKQGDLIGYIGGDFGSQIGATYMEFKYVA